MENNVALNAGLPREWRINGLRLRKKFRRHDLSAELDSLLLRRRRRRRRYRGSRAESTKQSLIYSAKNTATRYRRFRRQFSFLEDRDLFRNRARLHQLSLLDQSGHRLDDLWNFRRRRRWRRGRRRCNQQRCHHRLRQSLRINQWNQHQHEQYKKLNSRRENNCPSGVRLFPHYARFNKFVKHVISCRPGPSAPAPLLFEFSNRMLSRKQALRP